MVKSMYMHSRNVWGEDVYKPKRNAHSCKCRSDSIIHLEIIFYLTILSRGPWDTSLIIQALSCRKKTAITKNALTL
jgi:hypothetical protein